MTRDLPGLDLLKGFEAAGVSDPRVASDLAGITAH